MQFFPALLCRSVHRACCRSRPIFQWDCEASAISCAWNGNCILIILWYIFRLRYVFSHCHYEQFFFLMCPCVVEPLCFLCVNLMAERLLHNLLIFRSLFGGVRIYMCRFEHQPKWCPSSLFIIIAFVRAPLCSVQFLSGIKMVSRVVVS